MNLSRRTRFGLQTQLSLAMGVTLLMIVLLLAVLLQRQHAMQQEVDALGRQAVQSMAAEGLTRRGSAMAEQLADSLANPMYYSDLDAIGVLVREATLQPDVAYVLVFDEAGNVVNDGSWTWPPTASRCATRWPRAPWPAARR